MAQHSDGNSNPSPSRPLQDVRIHLHKSIPHLSKRTPILRNQLESLGAKLVSRIDSPEVTHVVLPAEDFSVTEPLTVSHGTARFVTEQWLQQCILSKQLAHEGPHLVSPVKPSEAEPPLKKQKTQHPKEIPEHETPAISRLGHAVPQLNRQFVAVPGVTTGTEDQTCPQIRCVTYNILADKYARAGRTHHFCPAPLRAWSSRWPRLHAELQRYSSDIYCLQEVDEHLFHQDIKPSLASLGYSALYLSRGYGRKASKGVVEGIALAYRDVRLSCRASSSFRFAERVPDAAPGAAGGIWQAVAAKEEGAIMALLELQPSGRLLLAAATHLWYDPHWPDLKVAQAHILCREIADFLQLHAPGQQVPVIIGGDFNSLWRKYRSDQFDQVPPGSPWTTSGVYTLLTDGQLDHSHPHHPHRRNRPTTDPLALRELQFSTAGLQLRSAFLGAHGHEPPLTNKHALFAGCLDYVWFTPDTLRVVETLEMPYDHAGVFEPHDVSFPPIPNEVWPSDHLAVGATLQLLPPCEEQGEQQG